MTLITSIKFLTGIFCLFGILNIIQCCKSMENNNSKIKYGKEVKGIRIGLSSHKDNYLEAIWLDLYIENNSEDTIYFVSTLFLKNFTIEIKNSRDEQVPFTPTTQIEFDKINSSDFFGRASIKINPGQIYQVNPSFNLSKWYNLNAKEKYLIKATLREGLTIPIYPVSGELYINL